MRPLVVTKGQPYRACAAPDRESKQQDCSLNRCIQVGRKSAKKYGYQHRPPLEGVIESNAWETVVGGGTLECAKIETSRGFPRTRTPEQARPDVAPMRKVNHSQCIRVKVLIAFAHESCLLNVPRIMYTNGTGLVYRWPLAWNVVPQLTFCSNGTITQPST